MVGESQAPGLACGATRHRDAVGPLPEDVRQEGAWGNLMSKLKYLSRRPIKARDIIASVDATRTMPDQAIALTSGALVERALERAIQSRMVKLSRTERRELFFGMGPLATLSAKIRMAHALALVGPGCRTELERIKDIRNQFAHSFHPLQFKTREVARHCALLTTPERATSIGIKPDRYDVWPPTDPRVRYWVACWIIWIAFAGRGTRRPKKHRTRFSRAILTY